MLNLYKSNWFFLFKVALMLFSFYFILFHIRQNDVMEHIKVLRHDFLARDSTRIYILSVSALMILNWFIETVKWQYLTSFFYPQSIFVAGRSVLSGLAVSIFTPNRSGEFAGRIFHLPSKMRLEGAVFSVIGSAAQLLITVTAGCFSLFYLFIDLFPTRDKYVNPAAIVILLVLVVLHYWFFFMRKYWNRISLINALKKYSSVIRDTGKLSPPFLLKIYVLSLLRYSVFSFQFILLLKTFDIMLPYNILISLVMISFLFITVIPSFAISEIGIRGSVCIFFFSKFTQGETGVLIASTTLWLINIAAPALIGSVGMLYFKKNK